jgi:hypothetical protein
VGGSSAGPKHHCDGGGPPASGASFVAPRQVAHWTEQSGRPSAPGRRHNNREAQNLGLRRCTHDHDGPGCCCRTMDLLRLEHRRASSARYPAASARAARGARQLASGVNFPDNSVGHTDTTPGCDFLRSATRTTYIGVAALLAFRVDGWDATGVSADLQRRTGSSSSIRSAEGRRARGSRGRTGDLRPVPLPERARDEEVGECAGRGGCTHLPPTIGEPVVDSSHRGPQLALPRPRQARRKLIQRINLPAYVAGSPSPDRRERAMIQPDQRGRSLPWGSPVDSLRPGRPPSPLADFRPAVASRRRSSGRSTSRSCPSGRHAQGGPPHWSLPQGLH